MKKSFIKGLNHLGLVVEDIAIAKSWFINTLNLTVIEDRGEIIFLHAGKDIIAIKTPAMAVAKPEHGGESDYLKTGSKAGWQALDHYGFFAETAEAVLFLSTRPATISCLSSSTLHLAPSRWHAGSSEQSLHSTCALPAAVAGVAGDRGPWS